MKTVILLAALFIGALFPYSYNYSFMIRYLLMGMLFFSFIDISFNRNIISLLHFEILFATIIVAVAVYFLLERFNTNLAEAAFITAIGPTATSSPVIISLKKGKVEFVTFSVLLNNLVIALVVPFFLSALIHTKSQFQPINILLPILFTISIPLIAVQVLKKFFNKILKILRGWQDISFYLLVLNVYIASSEAAHYINTDLQSNFAFVVPFAITSIILCFLSFSLGRLIGGKNFPFETGQALGQKNNAFTIWLALTFINPITVLGPVFYVFAQNIYISWQLYRTNTTR